MSGVRITKDNVLRELGGKIHTGSMSKVVTHLKHEMFTSSKSRERLVEALSRNKKNEHAKRIQAADLLSGEDFKKPVYKDQRLVEAVIISAAKHSNKEHEFGNMYKLLQELLKKWVEINQKLKSDTPLLRANANIVKEIIRHIPDASRETQENVNLLLDYLMSYHYTKDEYNTRRRRLVPVSVYPFINRNILREMEASLPGMALGKYNLVHDFVAAQLLEKRILKPVNIRNNISVKSGEYNAESLHRQFKEGVRVSGSPPGSVKTGITIHSEARTRNTMSTSKAGSVRSGGSGSRNNGKRSQLNLSRLVQNNGKGSQINLSSQVNQSRPVQNTRMTEAAQKRPRNNDDKIARLYNEYSKLNYLYLTGRAKLNNLIKMRDIFSQVRVMTNQNIKLVTQTAKNHYSYLLEQMKKNVGVSNSGISSRGIA